MTNINCSSDCVYQKDGKCSFNKVNSSKLNIASNCAYFVSLQKSNNK